MAWGPGVPRSGSPRAQPVSDNQQQTEQEAHPGPCALGGLGWSRAASLRSSGQEGTWLSRLRPGTGSAGRGWEGGPAGAERPLPSPGGVGGSWKLLTMDRDLMVAQFSTPSLPPSLVSAGGPGRRGCAGRAPGSALARVCWPAGGRPGGPAAWSANCQAGVCPAHRFLGPRPGLWLNRAQGDGASKPRRGVCATPAGGAEGSALRKLPTSPLGRGRQAP